MSNTHAEGIEAFSKPFSKMSTTRSTNLDKNYVPARIVVSMQEEDKNIKVIGKFDIAEDDVGNLIPEYNRKSKRIWPSYLSLSKN